MTGSIDPTAEQLAALAEAPSDVPLRMLNLLRYREVAAYPEGSPLAPAEPISGREAYQRYSAGALECVSDVGGEVFYYGACLPTLIGPEREQWDDIALIQYPSRTAFESMIASEKYQEIVGHRSAALQDSRLVPTIYS